MSSRALQWTKFHASVGKVFDIDRGVAMVALPMKAVVHHVHYIIGGLSSLFSLSSL